MSNHFKGWNATIVGTCQICDVTSPVISDALGLCPDCISRHPEQARKIALGVHARSRKRWALPGSPPRDPEGIVCNLCVNQCRIPKGECGYCGLRHNTDDKMNGVSFERGNLSWYYDPLPTNCVDRSHESSDINSQHIDGSSIYRRYRGRANCCFHQTTGSKHTV